MLCAMDKQDDELSKKDIAMYVRQYKAECLKTLAKIQSPTAEPKDREADKHLFEHWFFRLKGLAEEAHAPDDLKRDIENMIRNFPRS